MERLNSVKQIAFEQFHFDCLLLTNRINIFYLTGFTGASFMLISRDEPSLVYTSQLNYEQAKNQVKNSEVELLIMEKNVIEQIADQIMQLPGTQLMIDSMNANNYLLLMNCLKKSINVQVKADLIMKFRAIKDNSEINLLRKAAKLTSDGMKIAHEMIRDGIREYEVAAELEYGMRKNGGSGTAFPTIVASGYRSAFPHAGNTEKKIRKGDLVIVDIGSVYKNYVSDMTRTFIVGKASEKQKKMIKSVKSAQDAAYKAIKPDTKVNRLDSVARKLLDQFGYGNYFVHGLGHGIGLEVHEPPAINLSNEAEIKVGNVITIEPGVYIKNFGGVRIEDSVLVKEHEIEKLTNYSYDFNCK